VASRLRQALFTVPTNLKADRPLAKRIRVLIADDHAILRAGLKLVINAQPDIEVVGEAADGPETLSRVQDLDPDLVVLELDMPGAPGSAIIEQLVRLDPSRRILVLTGLDDPVFEASARQAGASGYIVKRAGELDLLTAIRNVHHGGSFVRVIRPGPKARGRDVRHASSRPLSPREAEVLRLLAQGYTNQEAADRLSVSVKTLETHRKRLGAKLGLKTRAELFRFAVDIGLLDAGAPQRGVE
jgi:two-component system response regulator NreC